ncbi:MAG: polyprenyl synthetase [Acidobacteria bacterium]|nr:MAG: polyprenyl synthetase [Acidobacteriota bacterium]
MKTELSAFFDRVRPAIEATLDGLLPAESSSPVQIHKAMRYSTLGGGKRIRSSLCVAAFAAYQENWKPILPVAAAVELIHAYSLIHDDLPAMDDDDFRRGKPSCHKQFNEAIAILAGDALLTLAFEVLARSSDFPADRMLEVMSVLGRAAGTRGGMIAGQVLDLEAEGAQITAEQLEKIHRSKTGALIGASVWIGAYLGGAPEGDVERIEKYSDRIGLAFQVIDDILDTRDGKDRDQKKATYPGLHGLEQSQAIAHDLTEDARRAIAPIGKSAGLLVEFCDYLETRTH